MDVNKNDTAVLITDPQNDFLSEQGVTWQLFGDSIKENNTVENIERLIQVAKSNGYEVFISPHYYYPTDHGWKFEGTLEKVMHDINMFDREGALSLEGFTGSGADWLERYKPLIEDGKTVIASPQRSMARRTTTSCCNFASAASARSSWQVCRPTYASRLTCANYSSGGSRSQW